MFSLKLIVLVVASNVLLQHSNALEVQLDRVELVNSSYIENYYNVSLFRVSKFNRTAYVLHIVGELYVDLSDEFSVEATFYYNRFNNNQYNKSPARIPKQSICSVGERFYKGLLMEQLKSVSNLPQFEDSDEFCPFPKVLHQKSIEKFHCDNFIHSIFILIQGSYWIKNFNFDDHRLPQSIRSGNWIMELTMYRGKEVFFLIKFYVRVTGSWFGGAV